MNIESDNPSVNREARRGNLRKAFGVLLSLIGLFWLAKSAGWMPMEHGQTAILWPIVLIAVGLLMFFSSGHWRNRRTA